MKFTHDNGFRGQPYHGGMEPKKMMKMHRKMHPEGPSDRGSRGENRPRPPFGDEQE